MSDSHFCKYPFGVDRGELDADDLGRYGAELEQRASGLFISEIDKCSLELTLIPSLEIRHDLRASSISSANDESSIFREIKGLEQLQSKWKMKLDEGSTCILIINRKNSWSRMKITLEMFKYMGSSLEMHPRFLDFVFGFAQKSSSQDEIFVSLSRKDTHPTAFEVSYNLRYFEPHGRQLEDPWSCRQTAIHDKYYVEQGNSSWIVIQPPASFRGSVQDAAEGIISHPLALHIRYIRSATTHWRSYLSQKGCELLAMDSKVSVQKSLKDFRIDFCEIQKTQSICRKLSLALAILEGIIGVLNGLNSHAESMDSKINIDPAMHKAFRDELDNISLEVQSHISNARSLLEISDRLFAINQTIISFRNQELLAENGKYLGQLAQGQLVESRSATMASDKTHKDSRIVRIATIVAMFYLPATLVLSFFSTGLVSFYPNEGSDTTPSGVRMRVHSQVWIALIISLVLAGGTMFIIAVWDRHGRA